MENSKNEKHLPEGYVALKGSERRPSKEAKLLGPADEAETFNVTIVLRRRIDGAPLPDFDYFVKTPPGKRKRYEMDEFTEKYGAHPDDINKIVKFAKRAELRVLETHAARRTVIVSGTVAQMSKAFAVKLGRYGHTITAGAGRNRETETEIYRGRDGFIHAPKDIAEVIMGVFGLDNRNISRRNSADPVNTTALTVQQVTQLYNFPANPATGQTIGIAVPSSRRGYYLNDLKSYFGPSLPKITPISCYPGFDNQSVDAVTTAPTVAGDTVFTFADTTGIAINARPTRFSNAGLFDGFTAVKVTDVTPSTVTVNVGVAVDVPAGAHIFFNADSETTQDICIAASAAPGADIAVYFSFGSEGGWVSMINRATIPNPGDPVCSVLSSSYAMTDGDDTYGLAQSFVSIDAITAVSAALQSAALLGDITICFACGDRGSSSSIGNPPAGGDGKAHVQYPGSDPWVLSVGGTTIGNIVNTPLSFDEYVWNDPDPTDPNQFGTTGGGVSDFFARPSYQDNAGVPKSVNDNTHVGRGVPDVAGNASLNSGYSGLVLAGKPYTGNGTSASAPQWAGLIAVINAALGEHVGFINPSIYSFGSNVFRDINPPADGSGGPTDNSNSGITGYPAGPGWDACTGWGSPNGVALLTALQQLPKVYISGGYQSPDIILTDLATSMPVPIGGAPGGSWDTLLEPDTDYGFSAIVHNDSGTAANNIVVRFWAIPGGIGTNGTMVGTPQTVSVPPFSYVAVPASAHFTSASPGQHTCAVVSIYNPAATGSFDATSVSLIPDPGSPGTHGYAAWRNTDSMMAISNSKFSFILGLGEMTGKAADPIKLQFHPVHVPNKWNQMARVREIENMLSFVGAKSNVPLYLLPEIKRNFHSIHLKTKVTITHGGKIEERETGQWHIIPNERREKISLEVSGEIPKSAKNGDIVLINVIAQYPKTQTRAARSIEFLEVVHIKDELKR